MEYTAEEIARHYNAAMDSVNLINAGKPSDMNDTEWADTVQRNVKHLKIMVAKSFWTDEDLTPFKDAIVENGGVLEEPVVEEPVVTLEELVVEEPVEEPQIV